MKTKSQMNKFPIYSISEIISRSIINVLYTLH